MRVDRNGSVLALLLLRLPIIGGRRDAVDYLCEALAERLRLTDTVGILRDGRVGVLLPDTPSEGAWKVANDIRELFGDATPLDCEVLMYPDSQRQPWSSDTVDDGRPIDVPANITAGVAEADASFERLLASPLPWWKRATDLIVGGALLVLATPLIAACGAAVMLTSRGGPFFAQEREGLGGRRFRMFKIRTMGVGAEGEKSALLDHSDQDGPAFKMKSDPRVTRIGRLLRLLSLDELPQLVNVLRGEMSLVGPRPLPVEESRQCEPWQRRRLQVTPGITCIWQVRGRSVVSFDEWIRMDLQYMQRRSLLRDLGLILQTAPALVLTRGPR